MIDNETMGAAVAVCKSIPGSAAARAEAAAEAAAASAELADAAADRAASYEHPDTTLTQEGNAADAKAAGDKIAELKSAVEDIEGAISKTVSSKNLINPDLADVGRLQSDGTIQDIMTNYKTSDYILLTGGKTYVYARESLSSPGTAMITGYFGYGFYDTSKNWVSDSRVWNDYSDASNPPVLTITPANDCYIRVCANKDYFADDTTGKIILQEGLTIDGYEAYFAPHSEVCVLTDDDIVQTSGSDTDKIMSQKAVTDYVDAHQSSITVDSELSDSSTNPVQNKVITDVVNAITDVSYSINLYDKDTANPQDKKYYDNNGAIASADAYAITGLIPVEAEKTYTFSSTEFSTVYAKAKYFGGETGQTYLSEGSMGVMTFTTPENCTFVSMQLFARIHTTDEFNAAISAAQLEAGSTPHDYEPYGSTRYVPLDALEYGDKLSRIPYVMTAQSQINLYDKTNAVNGKYYYSNNGTVESSNDYAISGLIPVEPNTQYCVSIDPDAPMNITSALYEFNASKEFIGIITTGLGGYVYGYLISFTTSPTTKYISVNLNKASHTEQNFNDTIDTMMVCYGTQRPLTYAAYNAESVVLADKLSNAYFNPDCFAGKKWMATGTSITWYDSKAYEVGLTQGEICRGYVGNVARRKRLIVDNQGISGSTLGNVNANSLINRYQSLDWANTDIATLEYGVNDLGNNITVGTSSDAAGTGTFAACLKTVIEYALAQNPTISLVICTEPDVRGTNANNNGNTLKDYTDVTLEIAAQYRLPVCDWYYHSGINALNKGDQTKTWMTVDGTHPSDAGHLRMGAMLNQVFDSLIC